MKLNLSLGQRLGLGFLLLGALVLLTTGLGLGFARSVTRTGETIQVNIHLYQQADEISHAWTDITATIDRMLLTRQTGGFLQAELNQSLTQFDQQLTNLSGETPETAVYQPTITTLNTISGQLTDQVSDLISKAQNGQWAQAQVLRHTEISSLQRRFDEQLNLLTQTFQSGVRTALEEQNELQGLLRLTWIIAAIVGLGGGSMVGYIIWRSTTDPINQLIAQTRQVIQRDFQPLVPLAREDELGRLSQAFVQMTDWLRQSYLELEDRVTERTLALTTSIEISRSLSTILEPKQLIDEVVNQVQTAFNFYYAQIYLMDETSGDLVLQAGTGRIGQALLQQGHRLPRGRGLVGRAAAAKTAVIVPDVTQEPNWLANPLLPDTRAEIAVPILIGSQVLGVLDVQQNITAGLTATDADLLQSVASQVAIALRNARLFDQIRAQAEQQSLLNRINQRIQISSDINQVLQVAAQELTTALGVKRTQVQLYRRVSRENE